MTRAARVSLVLVVAVMAHTAVAPHLRVGGVAADVLLVVTIAAGIVGGAERGALVGFLAGLLADCFLQTPFGLSALTGTLVGHVVGALSARTGSRGPWLPVLTAAAAGAAGVMLFAVLGAVLGEAQLLGGRLVAVALGVAATSAVLLPLALRPLRWALDPDSPTGVGRR
jgi:rod shape-determining protein MreD